MGINPSKDILYSKYIFYIFCNCSQIRLYFLCPMNVFCKKQVYNETRCQNQAKIKKHLKNTDMLSFKSKVEKICFCAKFLSNWKQKTSNIRLSSAFN